MMNARLTDLEISFIMIEIHNAVARLLNSLCGKGIEACKRHNLLTSNSLQAYLRAAKVKRAFSITKPVDTSQADVSSNDFRRRARRWVYTGFLGALTGLAKETDIEKLKTDTINLKHVEEDNASEIGKLERQSNKIVDRIGAQNEKLLKLYRDESDMNVKLTDLLQEDAAVGKELALLVRALEVVTDINIEYSVIATILELIPVLLSECRQLVHGLFTRVLPHEILMHLWRTGNPTGKQMQHVHSEVVVSHDTMAINYYIPEYMIFDVVYISFLPISTQPDGHCVRIGSKPSVIAVGMSGEFFEYDNAHCIANTVSSICSAERVTIKTKPVSCAEFLATRYYSVLPEICTRNMKVGVCGHQEYFRKDNFVYLFSPRPDIGTVSCSEASETLTITMGISRFNVSRCSLRTSELLILGSGYNAKVVDLDSRSGIGATVAKLGSVLSDINLGHSISFLNDSELLSSFLAASGVDNLDLAMAEKELKKFRTVDYLANYTVFNFDLNSPLGISSAVTGAYAGMGLLVCFISVLCCCTCECGRAAIFAVLKGLGKLLLWLGNGLFCWLLPICYKNYKDSRVKEPTVATPSSVLTSSPATEEPIISRREGEPDSSGIMSEWIGKRGQSPVLRQRDRTTVFSSTPALSGEPVEPGGSDGASFSPSFLVSPWRVETYADSSRHLLRGTSFETLEYISGSGVILNSSGLRVVCESPDLDVIDKFEHPGGK